ncbi:hypothetical protein HY523_00590 [Candidatus Berkelbacteria bacterium]|nr:hypothetical protein [Candidatus Berkelbacteria bacterium]
MLSDQLVRPMEVLFPMMLLLGAGVILGVLSFMSLCLLNLGADCAKGSVQIFCATWVARSEAWLDVRRTAWLRRVVFTNIGLFFLTASVMIGLGGGAVVTDWSRVREERVRIQQWTEGFLASLQPYPMSLAMENYLPDISPTSPAMLFKHRSQEVSPREGDSFYRHLARQYDTRSIDYISVVTDRLHAVAAMGSLAARFGDREICYVPYPQQLCGLHTSVTIVAEKTGQPVLDIDIWLSMVSDAGDGDWKVLVLRFADDAVIDFAPPSLRTVGKGVNAYQLPHYTFPSARRAL